MSPPSGDNTLEWDGGKGSAVMQLSMKVAKLETFVRQLEKDIESSEGSKERLSKIESRLDVLAERLGSIEKDIDALDDLKSAAKWINPKMLGGLAALLLGGSVAGNATLDAVTETHDEQKIEKVDQILQMLERNGHNG
jgi:DNA repair exonuclease SbcCD ATPase subunit